MDPASFIAISRAVELVTAALTIVDEAGETLAAAELQHALETMKCTLKKLEGVIATADRLN